MKVVIIGSHSYELIFSTYLNETDDDECGTDRDKSSYDQKGKLFQFFKFWKSIGGKSWKMYTTTPHRTFFEFRQVPETLTSQQIPTDFCIESVAAIHQVTIKFFVILIIYVYCSSTMTFGEASLSLLAKASSLFKSTSVVDVAAALREKSHRHSDVVRRVNVSSLSPSSLPSSSSSKFAPLLLNGRRFC